MYRSIWILAAAMCFATTTVSAVAFMRAPDHSLSTLALWGVIAVSLVAPLLFLPGILNTASLDQRRVYSRGVRFIILAYLPLQSALMLLAFGGR